METINKYIENGRANVLHTSQKKIGAKVPGWSLTGARFSNCFSLEYFYHESQTLPTVLRQSIPTEKIERSL